MADQTQPFADAVADYALAGWPCILPVPPATKTPPPVGFTGAEGRDTNQADLVGFLGPHGPGCRPRCDQHDRGSHSIALRMPEGVIGIDVDAYKKGDVTKHGDVTFAAHLELWGPLPPTWISTARGLDGPIPSGIRFYQAPPVRYATLLRAAGGTADVEIIQRHHRYAVVWPSPHPGAGPDAVYQWYDPESGATFAPPKPNELPWLPQAWVDGLVAGASAVSAASADVGSGRTLLDQLLDDWRPECADLTSARLSAVDEFSRADAGSRHDTMTGRVHQLVQLAAAGHTGVAYAFTELRELWAKLTAGEDRADELERMLLTSARKAVTAVGLHQVHRDPCLLTAGGFVLPPTAPGDPGDGPAVQGEDLQILEPPRWSSVREVIGAGTFDPNAGLDQPLAEAVLQRAYPALRYAYDSGGWLLRAPERWELHGRLSAWAVAQVAPLMPVGDSTAEKGSEPFERSKRRTRLMSTPGARAIAGKMDDLVIGGMHPASVALSELDADPEVLWAGGVPWDLRRSLSTPVPAGIDLATPHLHTAGVAPAAVPTPLWDAFTAAVWPDPEVRAWALRVLSIALTGHADRALPILIGETGRGKTQFVHLVMSLLGSYAHAADPRLMSPAGESAHASIVFALKGRRLSFIDEGPREGRVAQERLKQLTGGGELTANQMNQNPITFTPTHTLVLTTNEDPPLVDPALRSRTRLIPCDGDPELVRTTRAAIGHVSGKAWRAEAPGVLAAMMGQAAAWLADPVSAHVSAAPAHLQYLAEHLGAEQDPVTVWLSEECEPFDPGTPSRELYQAFTASCLRNNLRRDAIPSESKWGRALTRLGFPSEHSRSGKHRALRVRTGGFLPGMEPPTPSVEATRHTNPSQISGIGPDHEAVPESRDGLTPSRDGLVTGLDPQPVTVFPQVNPTKSVDGDGCDGFEAPNSPSRVRAHAREERYENAPNPSHDPSADQPLTGPSGAPIEAPAPTPKKATKPRSEEATRRSAEVRAEKRAAAIDEAAGAPVQLPAVLTRDGVIRSITLEQADALLTTITGESGHGELTVDVEHTGYPIGHRYYALRTVQLGDENLAVVLDHEGADAQAHDEVARRHLAAARVLHAHAASADIVPLAEAGLLDAEEAWGRMIDTGTLAKIADPALTGNSDDLKGLAKALLGNAALAPNADKARAVLFKAGKWKTDIEVTHEVQTSGWAQVNHHTETMARYDGSDVLDCAAIARRLPALETEQLRRERTAQRMTSRVAHTGFRFVPDQIDRLHDQHTADKAALAAQIPVENPGSTAQLGALLTSMGAALPRTDTGKPSVAKNALEPIAGARDSDRTWVSEATSDVQHAARLILDWRHADTALKLFLDPWRDMVRNGDGRARSTVHTLGADTGRMSSVRFNLQQISREGGMRACISADPGYLLITADFASVEIRVAAALSQDHALMEMLANGVDLHAEIARLVWGPRFTKANRYMAKRKVFGRIYGQGLDGMARTDGAGVDVARNVIHAMDAMTPGLTAWSADIRGAVEAGRTRYPSYAGRVIHMPKGAPHAGPNYAIQGTARELLIDALVRWDQTPWGGCTLMPVHDEILAMVPEGEAAEATEALKACMATNIFGVPIVAEADEPSFEWKDSA